MKKLIFLIFTLLLLSCGNNASRPQHEKVKMVLVYAIHYPDGRVVKEHEFEGWNTWVNPKAEVYLSSSKTAYNGIRIVPEPNRNPNYKHNIGIVSMCPLEVIELKRR